MRLLNPNFDLDRFYESLPLAEKRALLLDYDGTLAPFSINRSKAVPYPGAREALDGILAAGQTRVVLISGRALDDLLPLLGLKRQPEIWGSHGWERMLPDGVRLPLELTALAREGLTEGEAILHELAPAECRELKPASVALHWRGLRATEKAKLREEILRLWEPISKRTALKVQEFDGGFELRPLGRDKGFAVRSILTEMPEQTVAAFLGDDLTDEDGFQAIRGRGAGILVRKEARPTAADLWIKPPKELVYFLKRWL